jgi:hypothetical protein
VVSLISGRHLLPLFLPALKKLFHVLLTLCNSISTRGSDSGVYVDRQGRSEVVSQLRRRTGLLLRQGAIQVWFEEVLGRVLSEKLLTIIQRLFVGLSELVEEVCLRRRGTFA